VLEEIVAAFRKEVSFNEADRILHEDMIKAINFIKKDFHAKVLS
jgi:histidine ammonia-lyase